MPTLAEAPRVDAAGDLVVGTTAGGVWSFQIAPGGVPMDISGLDLHFWFDGVDQGVMGPGSDVTSRLIVISNEMAASISILGSVAYSVQDDSSDPSTRWKSGQVWRRP